LAADPGDGIIGDWVTPNGQAKIHIAKEGSAYVGRVAWLKTPKSDAKNPDPKQRSRQVVGTAILWGLHSDAASPGSYVDGHCYDPESGNTYKGKATLENASHLALRGYVGIPLFGRSETWTRSP
jgi:uncharacterized protein (DUF2147 family)